MANEAIKRYSESASGDVIQDYAVNDVVALERGAFAELRDPRAVSGVSAANVACAGIVAREKIANDGRTRVAIYKKGYFDVVASGSITLGAPLKLALPAGSNFVMSATSTSSGAQLIGYAEETASDAELFVMRLDL
jgi:hypothetical protein